ETLYFHKENDKEDDKLCDSLEANTYGSDRKTNSRELKENCPPDRSLSKNWPLISSIIVYCIFQLHDMAYAEIFPLWAVSPKKYGGLNYSSADVGEVLTITALLSTYAFIAKLSGFKLTLMIDSASVLKYVPSVSISTRLFLLQNRAVIQGQRGAANGISMSAMSLFKAAGPAGGGSM
ncbi:hypothetical protein PanWU01x14_209390, partial [Parasponia andersonii]